nr:hypothetical protein [Evansella caseinilytica]
MLQNGTISAGSVGRAGAQTVLSRTVNIKDYSKSVKDTRKETIFRVDTSFFSSQAEKKQKYSADEQDLRFFPNI